MKNKKIRNICITLFVITWTLLFHYESTRHFYLERWFNKPLKKTKFLFPPAGWIMFYNIGQTSGNVEVYGLKNSEPPKLIDPHDIFRVRTIGFDNIHRGIMGAVTYDHNKPQFCGFLQRRFPYFDQFLVTYDYFPSITEERYKRQQQVLYRCIK